ncbi:MAG: hypothetical protein QOG71_219 [Pyrinomonadaceae bacterium]|nr:hypothetical protein [Pyrinomonadaceae bacterium]
MKIKIDGTRNDRRNEEWSYLCFDEETGEFYIESHWDYALHSNGVSKSTLAEAKQRDKTRYDKAVKIIKEKLFTE